MREQIEKLINLQKIESETKKVNALLEGFPRDMAALDDKVRAFEQTVRDEKAALESLQKRYRSLDTDAKANREAVSHSQTRLSTVKTNKEYQALLKEIDEIGKKNSQIEDEMLALLDEIEGAEEKVRAGDEASQEFEARIVGERNTILKASEEAKARILKMTADRKAAAEAISPDLMARFTHIKKLVNGAVIVSVRDGVCEGCNMNIPRQLFNELQQADSLKFCPFCNRIIYWEALLREE